MRRTKTAAKPAPTTVAGMLDALQDRQRAARDDLAAARASLDNAAANLDAADAAIVRTAEILGLPVEG